MPFLLSTDTSCDRFKTELEKENVFWIPLTFTIEGETFDDNFSQDSEYEEFYKKVKAGAMPTTSQINTFSHEEFFTKILGGKRGELIHLTLSGGLSETVNSARVAAKSVMDKIPGAKIHIIDTISATQGHNILLQEAIGYRDSNLALDEAVKRLEEYKIGIQHWFMVDDLHHLKRGGRVSAASAFFGTLLKIKPVLTIKENGKLNVEKKAKGIRGALKYFAEVIEKHCDDPANGDFYIVNAYANENSALLKAQIERAYPQAKVRIGWIGPVIGAHTGAGTFGVAFKGKKRV